MLRVVAFLDPDDLLGFKASDARPQGNDPLFVDVIHRNATQWLGVFTYPLKAHDHELETRDSRKMIACGAVMGKGKRLRPRACGTAMRPGA
jgi:hypothetical protein